MSCFIAGARRGLDVGGRGVPLTARTVGSESEHGRWYSRVILAKTALPLVVVSLASTGCTLTSDPFDPGLVNPTAVDTSVESGLLPATPASPEDDPPSTTSTSDGSEGTGPNVPLDPTASGGGQLGGVGITSPGSTSTTSSDGGIPTTDGGSSFAWDAGAPVVPSVPCPGLEFGASCYAFFGQLASWNDAAAACTAWQGHLVTVESPEENVFLGNWPAQLGVTEGDGSGIWLGGTDMQADNAFLWADGSPLAYDAWGPNQPDNGFGVDCIEKRNDATELWYDQRCVDLRPYVCERPL